MPLTNAEKQAAHRQRRAAKIARYEAALREIVAECEVGAFHNVEDAARKGLGEEV